jgi:hypoxanthine phosphoribosyltransferase
MLRDLQRVLFHESTILRRLDEIAADITHDFSARAGELTVVAVLNGSFMFLSDLLRRIPLPLRVECVSVSSYHGSTQSSGTVTFDQLSSPAVAGRHVLILDDILDSGLTLHAIREKLAAAGARSVRICVLLRKIRTRIRDVDADYVGFDIADEFVVGYGLDFQEQYRNLPCIGVLRDSVIRAGLMENPAAGAAVATSTKVPASDPV